MAIGQIAHVRIQFRLLKQDDGSYTFREMLKAVYVLDNGLREVNSTNPPPSILLLRYTRTQSIARDRAMGILSVARNVSRDAKGYRTSRKHSGAAPVGSGNALGDD